MMISEQAALERVAGLTEIRLRTWVSRGWISPARSEAGYVYSEIDIVRCDLIRQLRDDMEIDRETVPVVLSLLDQVYGLRRELRTVMRAIERQPEAVRRQILDALE